MKPFILIAVLIFLSSNTMYGQKKSIRIAPPKPTLSNMCDITFYAKYSISKDTKIVPMVSGCNYGGTFKIVANDGSEVFKTDNIHFDWDLKHNGAIVPKGKYMWQYTYFNSKRQTNTNFGAFELIE